MNTNEFGQGSLEQFILNSNTLGEVGLDIEANAIFDPAAEEDVSIFMIPPTGDSFGRTADVNYNAAGYFDILLDNANTFSVITGTNTIIDGRNPNGLFWRFKCWHSWFWWSRCRHCKFGIA